MARKSITKVCLWCPMFSLHWPLVSGQQIDNLLCSWGVYDNNKPFSADKKILEDCALYAEAKENRTKGQRRHLTIKHWFKLTWWELRNWWNRRVLDKDIVELISYRQTEEFAQVKAQLVILTLDSAAKNGIMLRVL